jgi:cytidyltransferase-like protein
MAKKVMVFGTFDILHKGHLSLFKQAKKYGDYLIAVVGRDNTVKKIKGRNPRNNEKERLKKVAEQKIVDKAVLGMKRDMYGNIKKLKPDIICLGYDQAAFADGLRKFKIRVVRLKPYKPHKYKSSKML